MATSLLSFKLVAKNNCYAIHISSPTHACMQWIRALPSLVSWRLYLSGKRRMVILYIRAYRSSKTPDKYVSVAILKLVLGHVRYTNHCLVTCVDYCAIIIMASNTSLTMDHDREIAEFISAFR